MGYATIGALGLGLILSIASQIENQKASVGSHNGHHRFLKDTWTLADGKSLYASFSERLETKGGKIEIVFVEVETSKEIRMPIDQLSDLDKEYLLRHLEGVATGKVIGIVDGDTFDLLTPAKSKLRIRIQGIDAPERGQAYYKASKQQLADLVFGKEATITLETIDRYDRIVASARTEQGTDVGLGMIESGYAWHADRYLVSAEYAAAQKKANEDGIGLWAGIRPVSPEAFRGRKKVVPIGEVKSKGEKVRVYGSRFFDLRKALGAPAHFEHRKSQFQSVWIRETPAKLPTRWLNSSSNKRHNRSCIGNFGKTKRGRFCTPSEGVACKICGG
ncbi:MAG: micrococcal nuclease [Verrucomicrobiales bacterium]|jgi:micrococcal nuclease